MKIPLLAGAYADTTATFRTSYPVNLEPALVDSGISKGYLTNTPGIRLLSSGALIPDRGAVTWQNVCYRVMGSKICSVDAAGAVTVLGDVGNNGVPVTLDYSFDRLAIWSALGLYYLIGNTLTLLHVTDVNLGSVIAGLWIDGYYMSTDGASLIVTELANPMVVDPLKYGSSESDPDPILSLAKVRGEVYALNRNTIQNFQDVGGAGFPFANNPAGLIPKGVVGTHAWAYFLETFAFVGSARNEASSVYLADAGQSECISTAEVDKELAACTVNEQRLIRVEARVEEGEQRLYVHLPTKTLVYLHQASLKNQSPVWYILNDGAAADQPYAARNMALAYGQWMVGDNAGHIGALDETISTRFGSTVGWRFDTVLLYNESKGGIVKTLELVGTPGRATTGTPTCYFSRTFDGQVWSAELSVSMGNPGKTQQRVQWRPGFRFGNYVGLRFRGSNSALISWAALEADVEPLAV